MVAVADNQAAIRALHRDQVDALGEVVGLFPLQAGFQGGGFGEFRPAEVADQAEVGHHGTRQSEARAGGDFHHVQAAAGNAKGGDAVGEQGQQVIAGADHDGFGMDCASGGGDVARFDMSDQRLAAEGDALGFQPCRQSGDGVAAFHPQFVRRPQRALPVAVGQDRAVSGLEGGRGQQAALGPHVGAGECLQHGHRLKPLGGDQGAVMFDRDARLGGHFGPDIA